MFQPAQGYQTAGGFGLQMPQIGFQGLAQPSFQGQPLGGNGQQAFGQPAAEPTTFTIGIPGGFQFAPDAAHSPTYNLASGNNSPFAGGANRESTQTLRTRDAGLAATKKPKKKACFCC